MDSNDCFVELAAEEEEEKEERGDEKGGEGGFKLGFKCGRTKRPPWDKKFHKIGIFYPSFFNLF